MPVVPVVTGKTGADAIFRAMHKICQMITKYGPKLSAVLVAAEGAGVITAAQLSAAQTFITGAQALCDVFNLVSQYSGF